MSILCVILTEIQQQKHALREYKSKVGFTKVIIAYYFYDFETKTNTPIDNNRHYKNFGNY